MTVEEMKAVDIRTVNPEELVDITKLSIDKSLTGDERKAEFIRKVKNPYCYRVGNIIVKSSYSGDATLTERFQELVLAV
jgi:adenosine deaminase